MFINAEQLRKVDGELADIKAAILAGEPVLLFCPDEGWVETTQINMHLGRDDYHLGKRGPKRAIARG